MALEVIQRRIDHVVEVSDDQIAEAIRIIYRTTGCTIGVDSVIAVAGALLDRQQHMRQRLPTSLRAIERCLKLDDFDGQWCVPADLAKDHVGQFNDQLGITGDLGVEPTAGDAVCQLSAAARSSYSIRTGENQSEGALSRLKRAFCSSLSEL
jgi:hypothetical protein